MTPAGFVYKIATQQEWADALRDGVYEGSGDDRRDGFLHLSTGPQLSGTLARHFARQKNLVLIAFPIERLGSRLKWEASRGGDLFPHYYGAIDPGKSEWFRDIGDTPAGHVLPALEPPA